MTIYSRGYTHAGRFHADDVFSTALLRLLCPGFTVTRVSHVPDIVGNAIVYDIGGGRFDHHQPNAPARDNGVKYAALGLLWHEYGSYLCSSDEAAQKLDESLIQAIDTADNGGATNLLSIAIASFNPTYDSTESRDDAFSRAVDTAQVILKQLIDRERKTEEASAEVLEAYAKMKNGTVILKRFVPWERTLVETTANFVIYPSERGGYNLQGVPVKAGEYPVRVPLPTAWRGLENEALVEVSGLQGLRFCHRNGFLAAADSVETALKAAEIAQEQYK